MNPNPPSNIPPSGPSALTEAPLTRSASGRRGFLLAFGAGCLSLGLGRLSGASPELETSRRTSVDAAGGRFSRRTAKALGCEVSMLVFDENGETRERALDAAFAELVRVERVMSIYSATSQVCRLNSHGILHDPDPYLVQIVQEACMFSARSRGAFDITVQPLWALYSEAATRDELPSAAAIRKTRESVDWKEISANASEIRLKRPGMAITLNGIAQGFAADRAMEALRACGIRHALVNTGEVAALGHRGVGDPWVIGVQHPRQHNSYLGLIAPGDRCVSTSGDYETAFTPDFRFNHIFDPSTGCSPEEVASATVVAADATTADALSTAIFALGPERGAALVDEVPGADLLLVTKDGKTRATPGFPWNPNSARTPNEA